MIVHLLSKERVAFFQFMASRREFMHAMHLEKLIIYGIHYPFSFIATAAR